MKPDDKRRAPNYNLSPNEWREEAEDHSKIGDRETKMTRVWDRNVRMGCVTIT